MEGREDVGSCDRNALLGGVTILGTSVDLRLYQS